MPNQATHWPPSYHVALQTGRDHAGRLHLGSLDIPAYLLDDFARLYLHRVQELQPYFRKAYYGHELRGWQAATVHNLGDQEQPANCYGIRAITQYTLYFPFLRQYTLSLHR